MEKMAEQKQFNEEVLKKKLFDLSAEEIRNNFKKVKCILRRQKFGKGDKANYRYNAILKYHDLFEVNFNLSQQEYLNIILNRNGQANEIPDSLVINAYYVAVKAKRQDGNGEYYQLKIVISNNVRKKTFLRDLEVSNALRMKLFEFYDRPDFVEDELDERKDEDLF